MKAIDFRDKLDKLIEKHGNLEVMPFSEGIPCDSVYCEYFYVDIDSLEEVGIQQGEQYISINVS